ncbi:MAG: peptidoglycan DD-metalloendopeptidase family protein [Chitinophagaceae bacterium]|nr:peptidoglycan DD-metalloendopeptidase family protein [Chitinophagaceae bacterium]
MNEQAVVAAIKRYSYDYHPVVDFDPASDKLLAMDFTAANESLTADIIDDTKKFTAYVNGLLKNAGAKYGIGGYAENRTVYSRSALFGDAVSLKFAEGGSGSLEPRRLHLGIDIWGPVGTPVYAFMGGMVHSVAFNNNFGDYGATMILSHQLDTHSFYTLYGHISLKDIHKVESGKYVNRGEVIARFGNEKENGHWPPHLHFQIIIDLELREGDYPGVCRLSEKDFYLNNCPDPDMILQMNRYL